MQFILDSRGSYLGPVDLLEETGMAFVVLTSGIWEIESFDHSKEGYSGQNGGLLSRWGHFCLLNYKHKEWVLQENSEIDCLILWLWHYCIINTENMWVNVYLN